jgi:hypothetical protein
MKNTPTIFLPLLTLMFIYLKLTGVIAWSWWWVLAPIWAPVALALLIIAGIFVYHIAKDDK